MKRAIFFAFLMCFAFAASGKVAVGSRISTFPSPVWLDGKNRAMIDMLGEKKFTVLYFWQPDQASLSDFPRISAIVEKFKKDVTFAGVAVGSAEKLKRFPGAIRLGFPVNADEKGFILEKWELKSARMPMVWVLDKNGTLLWQGRSLLLPGVLNSCLEGKFDLQEEIRRNQFSTAVNTAVKAGEIEKAVGLLHQEWLKTPQSLELLEAQLALLTRKLKRYDDAFELVHQAQKKNPGNHRFYELEYKMLADPVHEKRVAEFFQRVMNEFSGKPGLLIAFASAEMARPVENLNVQRVFELAGAGWKSHAFKNDIEKGKFAVEYARLCHSAGRVDLACQLAQTAYNCFKKDEKLQKEAKKAVLYYGKLRLISSSVKVEDLKK